MKFDQALKPRIILEYTAIRIIISSISAGVCEWGFPIFLSILLSDILPFIRSSYSLKFHAQIAANGDSGSLDFKILRGSSPGPPGPPPPCASDSHLRRSLRNSMTTRIKLASPLVNSKMLKMRSEIFFAFPSEHIDHVIISSQNVWLFKMATFLLSDEPIFIFIQATVLRFENIAVRRQLSYVWD